MMIYVGQTRSRELIKRLAALGIGEMTVRGEFPPRRTPWALDNGAYRDYTAKVAFDDEEWQRTILRILVDGTIEPPAFIVAPDIVAGGNPSLEYSLRHALGLRFLAPTYLAVQDGMDAIAVARTIDPYDGLFVGGTLPWKIRTGAQWVALAHRFGRPCHIGRVGTPKRVAWAKRIGADSIDSCLPLWSEENLQRFLDALEGRQLELIGEIADDEDI